jgi:hypothetical protein
MNLRADVKTPMGLVSNKVWCEYYKEIMCIEMLIQVIISLLPALIAAGWILYKDFQDRKENNSKFYLEKYVEASHYILKILKSNNPTRRMAWVSAGSIADKLYILKDKITEKSDKEFFNIYLRSFAHDLNYYFKQSWPYFCWTEDATDLKDALERSGHGKKGTDVNSVPKLREIKFIDESSIRSIIDLTKDTWGYQYKNNTEFLTVMKVNFSELGTFIEQQRKFLKHPSDKNNGNNTEN